MVEFKIATNDDIELLMSSRLEMLKVVTHTAIGNLSSVNIDDLNSGIKRLNEVLEPLANFFNIFH